MLPDIEISECVEFSECVERKGNGVEVSPFPVDQEVQMSIIVPTVGLRTKTIFVHFVPKNPPLISRILLCVTKCCVIVLLTWH